MNFSDTTNKNGIIQTIEFWCGMSDGYISNDATLLKQMTARVNSGFDRILPLVLSYTDFLRFDDTNHTDLPVGTFNLVSGQSDYTITADDNSLAILNIIAVTILQSSSSTTYVDLERITLDDRRALNAISPNTSDSGVPTGFVENGNTIFFDVKPNYNATNGGKIFFEREPSYFASTDTAKQPGVPKPFHDLLALYPAYDWLLVFKNDNTALITRLEAQITRRERELSDMIDKRNPTVRRMGTSVGAVGSQSGRITGMRSDSNK